MRSLSLTRSSRGAAHAPSRRPSGSSAPSAASAGNLVDDAGHFVRVRSRSCAARRTTRECVRPARRRLALSIVDVDRRAPARRNDVEHRGARSGSGRRPRSRSRPPGVPAGERDPERRARDVARDRPASRALEPLARRRLRSRRRSSATRRRRTREARAPYDRASATGSTTVVSPSACRPARSTALLTWALGTSGR